MVSASRTRSSGSIEAGKLQVRLPMMIPFLSVKVTEEPELVSRVITDQT